MNARTRIQYEARAKIMKALAHPTRLFIVDTLSHKERCVADLTKLVGSDMSTVSKHLSILKNVGIIEDQKKGAHVYYRLQTPCVLNFFGCIEGVLRTSTQKQLRLVRQLDL